ncbi:MAG TPA: Sec-independent protein translocase protein TatB [Stellaceae bacterium]|nr:Sec-independent protein translocase protein TatB [Stellaceae bacterium]
MFELDWGKLVIIGIVALIAIGPKELPTVLRTLGQWMGKIKRMANEFQGQFQEALREAEMADLKKQADDLHSTVKDFTSFDPMADGQNAVDHAAEGAGEPASAATETPVVAAPATPAEAAQVLPPIDVPMPIEPEPVSEKDFAPTEPPPPKEAKQAGGGS